MQITVEARTAADPQACWDAWTDPDAVTRWNAASDDWCCPSCTIDLRVGGRQVSRMEAKDGSMGFDFAATFTRLEPPHRLAFELDDGRKVDVAFGADGGGTHVIETFDAETENDAEMQRQGWQAILDNFARFVDRT